MTSITRKPASRRRQRYSGVLRSAIGFPIPKCISKHEDFHEGKKPTQVIHAPLSLPNAICQAGSKDWKYSSGWKNVRMLSAFRILNATRNNRMSRAVVVVCALWNVRRRKLLGSSKDIDESLPTFVEDSEVGVDDIAPESRREPHV